MVCTCLVNCHDNYYLVDTTFETMHMYSSGVETEGGGGGGGTGPHNIVGGGGGHWPPQYSGRGGGLTPQYHCLHV